MRVCRFLAGSGRSSVRGAWWGVGGVDREGVAARDGVSWPWRGRLAADVVPGGAVVTNPAPSSAPAPSFFFSPLNE